MSSSLADVALLNDSLLTAISGNAQELVRSFGYSYDPATQFLTPAVGGVANAGTYIKG